LSEKTDHVAPGPYKALRFTEGLAALQAITETVLVELFEMTYTLCCLSADLGRNLAAIHRERYTIKPEDMRLVMDVLKIADPEHVLVRRTQ
jgi:histone H3/H4